MTSDAIIKITFLCTVFFNKRCYAKKYRLTLFNTPFNTKTGSVEEVFWQVAGDWRKLLSPKISVQLTQNKMLKQLCF